MKGKFFKFINYFFAFLITPIVLSGCIPLASIPEGKTVEKTQFVKGALVEKFPSFPIYPEAKIIESYSSGGEFGLSAYSEDSQDKVIDFYTKVLSQYENSLNKNGDINYVFEFRGQTLRGTVIVNTASDNKSTAITITVGPR